MSIYRSMYLHNIVHIEHSTYILLFWWFVCLYLFEYTLYPLTFLMYHTWDPLPTNTSAVHKEDKTSPRFALPLAKWAYYLMWAYYLTCVASLDLAAHPGPQSLAWHQVSPEAMSAGTVLRIGTLKILLMLDFNSLHRITKTVLWFLAVFPGI